MRGFEAARQLRAEGDAGARRRGVLRISNAKGVSEARTKKERDARGGNATTSSATPNSGRAREANSSRLPNFVRQGMQVVGQDPSVWEDRYEDVQAESTSMSVGVGILVRDMRRNLPLAVRELSPWSAEAMSDRERAMAEKARRDFWPSFWFLQIFINTVPWTPLILPLVLKVVPRDKVLPSQLIPEEDERIVRVLAMRDASPRERHS